VPVLQSAYLANSAVLPLMIVSDINDLIKLYSVILVVVFALVFILSGMVRRLNISKALKLGEE
jgi:putative ABC transport system permease protein